MSKVLGIIMDEQEKRVLLVREVVNGHKRDLKGLEGSVEGNETPEDALVRLMKDVIGFDSEPEDWQHFLRLEDGFDHTDVYRIWLTKATFAGFYDLAGFLDYEVRVWDIDSVLRVLGNKNDKNPGFPREYSWILPLATYSDKKYDVVATEALDVESLFGE